MYSYKGTQVYQLIDHTGKNVTSSKRGDITEVLQKGGYVLGQAAVDPNVHDKFRKDPNRQVSLKTNEGLSTFETDTRLGGKKQVGADVIYHYKGKMTISGSSNKIYAHLSEIDTAVIVKIDGKVAFAYSGTLKPGLLGSQQKYIPNLNGEHKVEVIIIQSGYRKDGHIEVGVVDQNGQNVKIGTDGGTVKTSFVDTSKVPDGAEYDPSTGSYKKITTSSESSSFKHIGKTTDGDDDITGTDKDEFFDATKGHDVINAGGGDDRVEVDADSLNGKTKLDGGNGYDTLLLEAPGSSINLSTVAKHADNFEAIDLKDGNAGTNLTLLAKDVLDITNNKDVVFKISGDKQDTVSGKGEWTKADDQSGVDEGYTKYQGTADNGQTVFIQVEDTIKTDF